MTSPAAPSSPEDTPFIRAIKHAVQLALRKAMRRVTIALGIAFCTIIGLGLLSWQSFDTAKKLRQEVISSCNSNNDFRAQLRVVLSQQNLGQSQLTLAVLDSLVTLLEGPHPTAHIKMLARNFEQSISASAARTDKSIAAQAAIVLAPRDCAQVFSGSAHKSPKSSSSSGENTPAPRAVSIYHENAALQGWSGSCLSFKNAPAPGDALNYEPCAVARDWQYYPATGQFRPDADLNLAAGDSGGHPVLVNASDTADSTINTTNYIPGPSGFEYAIYYFAGHANSHLFVPSGSTVGLAGFTGNSSHWALTSQITSRPLGSA